MSTLGARLRQLREAARLTQQEMAQKLGVNKSTYQGYETGRREPDAEFVVATADAFAVSLDWLIRGQGELPRSHVLLDLVAESTPADIEAVRDLLEARRLRRQREGSD